jgi:hypothetical protein
VPAITASFDYSPVFQMEHLQSGAAGNANAPESPVAVAYGR